jgi:hypothetical protein
MWAKHPEIAKKWTEKYGSKIQKKGKEKEYKPIDNKNYKKRLKVGWV